MNAEYFDEYGNLKIEKIVTASENATYAGTLAEYVGEERAKQILSSNMKNINDAGSYSKIALMDILGVSKEIATQMQHTGSLPSSITEEQRQRLLGEALMAIGGMTWNGEQRGNKENFSISAFCFSMSSILCAKSCCRESGGMIISTSFNVRFDITGCAAAFAYLCKSKISNK